MDYLGIQGHSTFYKCSREKIPYNGWVLVHNVGENAGSNSVKNKKQKKTGGGRGGGGDGGRGGAAASKAKKGRR
jgi:hypothetical protein